MKKLLTITVLLSSSLTYSACNIELEVKKDGAKTAYISGVSVSAKIQDALSTKCKITKTVMSKSDINAMKLSNAKKRYEALLAKNAPKGTKSPTKK